MNTKHFYSFILAFVFFTSIQAQVATCSDSLFIKTFQHKDTTLLAFDLIAADNNDVMGCGVVRTNTQVSDDAFIVRWDKNGRIVWQRTLSANEGQFVHKLLRLQDGNYMAIGSDWRTGLVNYFVFKFDGNGNVIFRKELLLAENKIPAITSFLETNQKEVVITGTCAENTATTQSIFFIKLDQNGNTLLSKKITPPSTYALFVSNSSVIFEGYSYICGFYFAPFAKGLLIKVNNANGSIVWSKVYDYNSKEAVFSQIFKYPGNKLCILGSIFYNEADTSLVLIADTSGTIEVSNALQYNSTRNFGKATIDKGGNIIWASYYRKPPSADFTMLSVNPYSGVNWSKNYPQLSEFPYPGGITFSEDSSLFVMGNKNIGRKVEVYLGRFSKDGNVGCAPIPLATSFKTGSTKSVNVALTSTDNVLTYPAQVLNIYNDIIKSGDDICKSQITCNNLKLFAPDTLCNLRDPLKVRIVKNGECPLTPQLLYDSSKMILRSLTDSAAIFTIHASGTLKIKARLANKCDTLVDSIEVFINPPATNLGADSFLCNGKSLLLKAGSNFKSYLWQDASTDSFINVFTPGLYWVKTTDWCSNNFSDSILISPLNVSIEIGLDRTKCNNDTVHLSAPSGFLNYTWSNNYSINSLSSQSVVVNPLMDTAYYIKAEKVAGCFAYDTIRVHVINSPTISLGADKSFCEGDSATFNAGSGFSQFSWSNGQSSQQIVTKAAGSFSVIGTTTDGCKSYDTVKVINVYSNPVVVLDHNNSLCADSVRILDAGNFYSYLWNNGSSSRKIAIRSIGTYAVEVTDNNGCKGKDSTAITTLLPLPSRFLPADTSLCSYSTTVLSSRTSFAAYLWSTGSSSPSISISQPGLFWLQVKDANNCVGKDSILISPKDCMKGFYIPTSFTPNKDGKNDAFHPMLFGNVKKYEFSIYNRWGQVIFRTSDLGKAWDGRFAGLEQDANVFVWICTYQFEGEDVRTEKGTVMLVR